MNIKQPIQSAHLQLQIPTATLIISRDSRELVFPAIDVDHNHPPKHNLNTVPDGPNVVSVTVEQISSDQARRESFGHSGIERLTVALPPDQFADLVKTVGELRKETHGEPAVTFRLDATVDENGNITNLARNGEPIVVPVSSGTVGLGSEPSSRAGGTKR